MSEDGSRPRARKAAGPDRPSYLTGADTDKVMAIVLALMSEISSLRERLDTHERLAGEGVLSSHDAVEAYRPDGRVEDARTVWRKGFIRRLFRVVTEEVEMAKQDAAPSDSEGDVE